MEYTKEDKIDILKTFIKKGMDKHCLTIDCSNCIPAKITAVIQASLPPSECHIKVSELAQQELKELAVQENNMNNELKEKIEKQIKGIEDELEEIRILMDKPEKKEIEFRLGGVYQNAIWEFLLKKRS